MPSRRISVVLACFVAIAQFVGESRAKDDTFDVRPEPRPGVVRVEAQLDVGGDVKLTEEGKPRALKMSVSGKSVYDEKLLTNRTAAAGGARSARRYLSAEAT